MTKYHGVEAAIREAIERGDFDNLPGKGKPLDLTEWYKTPEHLRMTYSVLKNAGYQPAEVQTKNELATLRSMIEAEEDTAKKDSLLKKLRLLSITDAVRMEKLKKR